MIPVSRFLYRNHVALGKVPIVSAGIKNSSGLPRSTDKRLQRYASSSVATAPTPKIAGQDEIKVVFSKEGKTYEAYGKDGDTLLDLVINNELDFDGYGACEGTLACSTCHVIISKVDYDRIENKPCDEELDMLDLAYDLTDTSRLGCQIQINKDLSGLQVHIPATRHDARS